jgi:hypothetical protein
MIKMNIKNNQRGGYVVITTVIFFLIISIAVISQVVIPTSNQVKSVSDVHKSRQGYLAADNINEDALYRLNGGRALPSTLSLPFSNGVLASASVTTVGSQTRIVTTGSSGNTTRYSETYFSSTPAPALIYAAQVGSSGLYMSGGGYIVGDVYSNGSITSDTSGPYITGSATVASAGPAVVNQTNSYTNGTNPLSIDVGTSTTRQDVAQSFQVTTSIPVTSVRFYVKKTITGSPGDATIRIMPDSSGKPSNSGTLGTGTLSASSVTTSFTYVNVPITQSPVLTPGTTYWVVVDNPSNSTTKYFTFAGTNNTYSSGIAKYGKWSSSNGQNSWVSIIPANTDLYFDVYVGGAANSISGSGQWNRINIGTGGSGAAWANQVNSASVGGTIYCQTGTYLYNLSNATRSCDTSRSDPPLLDYPITDQNITDWKALASAGGTYSGNLSIGGGTSTTTGPKKINGNLIVTGGSTLNLSGPVWVTGYIDLAGGSRIKLASSYGSGDGMIIADGRIVTTGGAFMQGSGTSGSYLVGITTSQCPTSGTCSGTGPGNAVDVEGGSGSIVIFAPYGTMSLTGGAVVNSAVAKRVKVDGGSHINYDSGLSAIDFLNSGSSGAVGNWNVDSWSEISQ